MLQERIKNNFSNLASLGVLFNPYIDSGDYHKGKIDQGKFYLSFMELLKYKKVE
jgi:hypothetical protein